MNEFYKDYIKNDQLRNIEKMNSINDGNRSLFESIANPEVIVALTDWINNTNVDCILIGGLALSYYIKPRTTFDIDMLFLNELEIPTNVNNFKRTREQAFQHNRTHVEIELITPEFINTPQNVIDKVFETALNIDGIKVTSISGLIALKLGRFKLTDQSDISLLVEYSQSTNKEIDLSIFNLSQDRLNKYEDLLKRIRNI